MSKEKLYTREQMLSFTEHCMVKLLTQYDETGMGEIKGEDLSRIWKILNEYGRKPKQR